MFCAQCGASNDASAKFCHKCGAPLAAPAPVAAPPVADPRVRGAAVPAAAAPPVTTATSPALPTILSVLLPGLGQFINSDAKKGAVMLILAFVLGVVIPVVGWLAILIWSAVDAYRVATGAAKRW
jgi:TM2 domain-containing membrane protein YozV